MQSHYAQLLPVINFQNSPSFQANTFLPYDKINTNKIETKRSFGILCVTLDGYVVVIESPSYAFQRAYGKRCGKLTLSLNEMYNLQMSSFPNCIVEGQYSLPRGKTEKIDKKNVALTKIREFIEETKYIHRDLIYYANTHYQNVGFKSFLTDKEFTVSEIWYGLDNVKYIMEYSIFVIGSADELKRVKGVESIMALCKCFSSEQYKRQFKRDSKIDNFKRAVLVPIDDLILCKNVHRLNIVKEIEVYKIFDAIKKYKSNRNNGVRNSR